MSVIVSLTSTSSRLAVLRFTLLSLLEQNLSADRIVLCISKEPYLADQGIKEVPEWLVDMEASGALEIEWVRNTGPYRKLIPVFRTCSDEDWIVTCDDDVIYGPQWLGCLVEDAKCHPDAVVCGRARVPAYTPWGKRQSYLNWPLASPGSQGKHLLPTGISGVLYRKNLLSDLVMYSDRFLDLAPKQDDLWFNLARQVKGSNVYVSEKAGDYVFSIDAPNPLSLSNAATNVSGWDSFIRAVFDRLRVRIKGYLGFDVCENDIVLKKIESISALISDNKAQKAL